MYCSDETLVLINSTICSSGVSTEITKCLPLLVSVVMGSGVRNARTYARAVHYTPVMTTGYAVHQQEYVVAMTTGEVRMIAVYVQRIGKDWIVRWPSWIGVTSQFK